MGCCALECGGVAGQWIPEFTLTSVLWGRALPLFASSIHFNAGYALSLSLSLSLSFFLRMCVWIVSSCSELDYNWIGFLVVWNLGKKISLLWNYILWIGFGVRNWNFLFQYLYRRDQTVSNVELSVNPPIPQCWFQAKK